jgi:hypothetical protein
MTQQLCDTSGIPFVRFILASHGIGSTTATTTPKLAVTRLDWLIAMSLLVGALIALFGRW